MIIFNQLALSEDRLTLNVDCEIDGSAYPNSYIKYIYLEYYRNRNRNVTGAPSDRALCIWSEGETPSSSAEVEVNQSDLSSDFGTTRFVGGMFYVLVHWIDADEEEHYDIGVVIDWLWIYTVGMRAVSEFLHSGHGKTCDVPDHLEQFILVIHCFQLAVEAKNMDMMDKLWGRFIGFDSGSGITTTCNCQ